jgi:HSP20 family protein
MKPAINNSAPLFTSFFNDDMFFNSKFSEKYPAVNVRESDLDYELELIAPGIKKDGFCLEIADDILTISGKTEQKTEKETKKYYRKEYSFESFSRQFIVPENIDIEHINATYTEGVLLVHIPKIKKAAPKATKTVTVK